MTSPRAHHLADSSCRNELEFKYYSVMSDMEERGYSEYNVSVEPHPDAKDGVGIVITAKGQNDTEGFVSRAAVPVKGEPNECASLEDIRDHVQATPKFRTMATMRQEETNAANSTAFFKEK